MSLVKAGIVWNGIGRLTAKMEGSVQPEGRGPKKSKLLDMKPYLQQYYKPETLYDWITL